MPLCNVCNVRHWLGRAPLYFMAIALLLPQPVAAQATAKPKSTMPFNWQDVGFTPDCNPNPAFERLLGIFARNPAPSDQEPIYDEGLYHAVSGETSQELQLDSPVDWHGLKLTGIRLYSGVERGPVNYYIYFEEGPDTVRARWNALGWKIPAGDGVQEVIENYAFIGVQARNGGGSIVACWRD